MKLTALLPKFVEFIPEGLEQGVLYISEPYGTAIHLCACGCGTHTVTPLSPFWPNAWTMTKHEDGTVSLAPSVFNNQRPCQAHYFIRKSQIEWT